MKGTALEWYDTQIWALQIRLEKKEICLGEYEVKKVELFKQAKEMEKEQLKEMYLKGIENYDPTFKQQEQ
jgi:hypothetical protein